jgi:hypothetical protein
VSNGVANNVSKPTGSSKGPPVPAKDTIEKHSGTGTMSLLTHSLVSGLFHQQVCGGRLLALWTLSRRSTACPQYCRQLTSLSQGLSATITLKNSERYSGIFSGALPESSPTRYVLKMTKKHSSLNKQTNGVSDEHVGTGPDYSMDFEIANIVDLGLENLRLDKSRAATQNGMFSCLASTVSR